jgi:hypothetical protein
MDMDAPDKVAYSDKIDPFNNLLHMQWVIAFDLGVHYCMRTEEVVGLMWHQVHAGIEQHIQSMLGLHTVAIDCAFDKSHHQSLQNPSARHLAEGKTRDTVEYPEAPNGFVKVMEVFRATYSAKQSPVYTYPTRIKHIKLWKKQGDKVFGYEPRD